MARVVYGLRSLYCGCKNVFRHPRMSQVKGAVVLASLGFASFAVYEFSDARPWETWRHLSVPLVLIRRLPLLVERSPELLRWLVERCSVSSLLELSKSRRPTISSISLEQIAIRQQFTEEEMSTINEGLDQKMMIGLSRFPNTNFHPSFSKTSEDEGLSQVGCVEKLIELVSGCLSSSLPAAASLCEQATKLVSESATDKRSQWMWDGDIVDDEHYHEQHLVMQTQATVYLLQSILILSRNQAQNLNSIANEVLKLLLTVQSHFQSSEIECLICQILGSLSQDVAFHDSIVESGWLCQLQNWLNSGSSWLQVRAAKVLSNLDHEQVSCIYEEDVYVYHPLYRATTSDNLEFDVVFLHGLRGSSFFSWRQEDGARHTQSDYSNCWPKDWLSKDFPTARLITLDYHTSLLGKNSSNETISLVDRSNEFLRKLLNAGVGQRPIIWFTHSMGGLLLKQMLVDAAHSQHFQDVLDKSAGVIFLSVPHHGSPVAEYAEKTKRLIRSSREVYSLLPSSPRLSVLHKEFLETVADRQIQFLTITEGAKMATPLKIRLEMVPPESSRFELGESKMMNDLNHINIIKPSGQQSPLYATFCSFIARVVADESQEGSPLAHPALDAFHF